MKRLYSTTAIIIALSSSPALAADLANHKAPPTAPVVSWAGFYAGLNAGGTFGNNSAVNGTSWILMDRVMLQ